jgi:hypothetical protein
MIPLKYWELEEKPNGIHLFCPILENGVKLGIFRAIIKELKELELNLSDKYQTALIYTKIEFANIIRMAAKLGYKPYYINLEYDSIWFKKEIGR